MECDLSSLNSIRNFANLYLKQEERLDILICNAGLGYSSTQTTEDGFDYVIQSNYLGHFLLTNLLLEKLKQSKPSRILNISSDLHQSLLFSSLRFDHENNHKVVQVLNQLIGQMH